MYALTAEQMMFVDPEEWRRGSFAESEALDFDSGRIPQVDDATDARVLHVDERTDTMRERGGDNSTLALERGPAGRLLSLQDPVCRHVCR
jgi:hypothetical protein